VASSASRPLLVETHPADNQGVLLAACAAVVSLAAGSGSISQDSKYPSASPETDAPRGELAVILKRTGEGGSAWMPS